MGLIGAFLLARKVKKVLFGLEPREIARLLEERSLEPTREGILAIDQNARVRLINTEALRLFRQAGLEEEPTCLDGYPLAKQGKGGSALGILAILLASVVLLIVSISLIRRTKSRVKEIVGEELDIA